MAKLTLNFFDSTRGVAISHLDVGIQKIHEGNWQLVADLVSDINGNTSVAAEDVDGDLSGYYEASAQVGDYFLNAGYALPTLKFIDVVPIRFGISDAEADTVILITLTPYGYTFTSKTA